MAEIIALRRTFAILSVLEEEGAVRFKRIAEEMPEASNSTISRLLTSLTELGAVEKRGRLYTAGKIPGTVVKDKESIFAETHLLNSLKPVVDNFAKKTSFTCGIFAPMNQITMRVALKADAPGGGSISHPGYERPMLPTHGFAQMFLAWKPVSVQKTVYQLWRDYHSAKMPPLRAYLAKLKDARRNGYCIETGEVNKDIERITAPVFATRHKGPKFVFGFNAREGAISRATAKQLESWIATVRKTADELTRLCGVERVRS